MSAADAPDTHNAADTRAADASAAPGAPDAPTATEARVARATQAARDRERKWQRRWEAARLFEAEPQAGMPKYFVNFPYPYMNGYLHLGHAFTLLRAEVVARYQRMRGRNVLFPFGFHCTGTPIVAAAQRVAEGEPGQMRSLAIMGITGELAERLADPQAWAEHFPERAREDLAALGVAVDWRRSFITTELNPAYDGFIRWQFNRLRAGNYLRKGSFPVVWCSERETVVGDHDRLTGEGETPQEFTLLKFRGPAGVLVAATLRPETVFGQTNLWVDGEGEYLRVRVDGEAWIISPQMAPKLRLQGHAVEEIGPVAGRELVGQRYTAPGTDHELVVLPSRFCDASIGSGLVSSVPSDAPDDWQGLVDLQNDPALCAKWGLDHEYIEKIEPLAIIDSGELGTLPAPKVCREMGVRNQLERRKLEAAKQQVYQAGFAQGTMLASCGAYAGLPVEQARERVRDDLVAQGEALLFYELTGPVKSRWLTDCTVKVVEDQWFLAYGDEAWTARAREALARLELFPPKVRAQFEHVLGWLRDWACVREKGLGTRLPWDERWVIESLSDSTVYMAYYTLAHHLEALPREALAEPLYEAVFGKGDPATAAEASGVTKHDIAAWRDEFRYWYPYDLRISGKDLIQNHLAFSLYNHTALFPPEQWPRGFALNGWVLVDGEKMSKSRGNFFTLRQLVTDFGADAVRLTLCNAGEGLDDPNWDGGFAKSAGSKLAAWLRFVSEHTGTGRDDPHPADNWLREVLADTALRARQACDHLLFRTALRLLFFELPRHYRWYVQRCEMPHRELLADYLSLVTRGLAPIAPHLAEEAWEALGGEGLAAQAPYPEGREPDTAVLRAETLVQRITDDIRTILKVAQITAPQRITLLTAPDWKWQAVGLAGELADERGGVQLKELMGRALPALPPEARKEAAGFLKRWALREAPKLGPGWPARYSERIDEQPILRSAVNFLTRTFGCPVEVVDGGKAPVPTQAKAQQAVPLRPAIFVEQGPSICTE